MTVKVTFKIGNVGGIMVDTFNMSLRDFFAYAILAKVDVDSIVKIDVV
jgi:hypothetical protein